MSDTTSTPDVLEQLAQAIETARVSVGHALRHHEKIGSGFCTAITDIRALAVAANACMSADDAAFSAVLASLNAGSDHAC